MLEAFFLSDTLASLRLRNSVAGCRGLGCLGISGSEFGRCAFSSQKGVATARLSGREGAAGNPTLIS